jgi:hypothetical protein
VAAPKEGSALRNLGEETSDDEVSHVCGPRCLTASSYAARRLGHITDDCRASWRANSPRFAPASRVSISELLAGQLIPSSDPRHAD